MDITLGDKFKTPEYGAAFLASLIALYNAHGFDLECPREVLEESAGYLGDNDVVGQFMEENFEETGNHSDYVSLKDIFKTMKDSGVLAQMGVKRSCEVAQKLRNKGYVVKKGASNGANVVRNVRFRDTEGAPPEDDDVPEISD